MLEKVSGKLTTNDQRKARLLTWAPWLAFLLTTVPIPVVFLLLTPAAATPEATAIYLLLSFVSLGLGLVVGLLILLLFFFYRRSWHSGLRDRLAADGITAAEIQWFSSELTSEERRIWNELKPKNPLLADAYCETLAARLTATRIIARARRETLRIERQINRTRSIHGVNTSELLEDLMTDRQRCDSLRQEAIVRLAQTKARLQSIEATANRKLNQEETDIALRRLASSQEHSPLALEMARLERAALHEVESRPILQGAIDAEQSSNPSNSGSGN